MIAQVNKQNLKVIRIFCTNPSLKIDIISVRHLKIRKSMEVIIDQLNLLNRAKPKQNRKRKDVKLVIMEVDFK
jgi:hypothetical protein